MKVNEWLNKIVEAIDLAPYEIQEAQSKRRGLENFFSNGRIPTSVYIQGSFSYGTAIKPVKKDKDGDFDLDLVCEVQHYFDDPKVLKDYIGDILKKSVQYSQYLESEGKRCWTLDYENFHIDLLPSIPDRVEGQEFIKITSKDQKNHSYEYKSSNPKGLTKWFLEINDRHFSSSRNNRKSVLFEKNKQFFIESMKYTNWNDVEDSFLSTPMQNAVKILKRHRDQKYVNTSHEDYKPISVIITVLMGLVMDQIIPNNNITILSILEQFINNSEKFILRKGDEWVITNPVDKKENLADKWHEDGGIRVVEFKRWLLSLNEFISNLKNINDDNYEVINKHFGQDVFRKVQSMKDKEGQQGSSLNNPTSKPWNKHVK